MGLTKNHGNFRQIMHVYGSKEEDMGWKSQGVIYTARQKRYIILCDCECSTVAVAIQLQHYNIDVLVHDFFFSVLISGSLFCFVCATNNDSCIVSKLFGFLFFRFWLVKFGDRCLYVLVLQ